MSQSIVLAGREVELTDIRKWQSKPRTKSSPRMFAVQLASTGEIIRCPDPHGRIENRLLLTTFDPSLADLQRLARRAS